MKFSGIIGLAIVGGCFVLPGCGDDDEGPSETGGAAGTGAGKGGSSGKAGSGGKAGGAGSSSGGTTSGGGGQAGDDSPSDAGDAGTPGSGGTSGEAGASGSGGDSGSPGSSGGAGESGAGGGGGDSGSPGNPDPASTACSSFPETVTLGPTIQLETYGAVLCAATEPSTCRLTTNTYSDGTNPCSNADSIAVFTASDAAHILRLKSDWVIISASAGTIDAEFDYYLSAIPVSTPVTAVIESPEGDSYSLVFEFGAGREFTLTSFGETS